MQVELLLGPGGCGQLGHRLWRPDFPGVYTRVMSYTSWIHRYVPKFLEPSMGPDGIPPTEGTPATHVDLFTPPSCPASLS